MLSFPCLQNTTGSTDLARKALVKMSQHLLEKQSIKIKAKTIMMLQRGDVSGRSVVAISLSYTYSGRPQESFQLPCPRKHGLQCLEVEEGTLPISFSFHECRAERKPLTAELSRSLW